MLEAIRLSRRGTRQCKGGPFGAVVVRRGKIIGRGSNEVTSTNDPTAHAEILAIRQACRRLKRFHLEDCELYTSCEPCPMCLAAIYWAHIPKVFYASTREDAARSGFDDKFLYHEIALPANRRRLRMRQILRKEARTVMAQWRELPDKRLY